MSDIYIEIQRINGPNNNLFAVELKWVNDTHWSFETASLKNKKNTKNTE